VLAGLGVAIVPQQSIALELEVGRLAVLDVASLPLQRSWYLVHRKEKRFSCVAEAFRTFVLQEACDHVGALAATGNGSAATAQAESRGTVERTP
jgi:DNA-binding transcriptional LysR family regulator